MSERKIYDMLIIGGGPAGYTAALYAARAGLTVLVLEKLVAGGQMALTHRIDNYPGFENGVDGFTLGENMRAGAERSGAETRFTEVLSLDLKADPKSAETPDETFFGRTVVFATGAGPRYLGVPREKELTGQGVHYCAACDGMFYRGRTVVVVGGGNSAAADALQLSRVAKKVILVHRRDTLRAERSSRDALLQARNVEFLWNSVVTELLYDGQFSGIRLRSTVTGEESAVDCDGIFISIGRQPATELVKGQLEQDEGGYVLADESTRTNIAGVFAVGDVRSKGVRQIVTAVADGAAAVHRAEEFLHGGP